MKILKRCIAWTAVTVTLLLLAMPMTTSAALPGFDGTSCLRIVTEPGQTSELVAFCKDGAVQPHDAMTWVDDSARGKVLSLDGKTEYLEIGKDQLKLPQMTFATWIYFRGTAYPDNPDAMYWQRLFTVAKGAGRYFTLTPHGKNEAMADGHALDGLLLDYFYASESASGSDYGLTMYTPATAGINHFGLPQNEWHHIAVTVDESSMKLYVDGHLLDQEEFYTPIAQMFADHMRIGAGIWSEPTLNALLDDTLLFEKALSAEQITALMQTGNIDAAVNAPSSVITEESVYLPTKATLSMSNGDPLADKPQVPFDMPVWGFALCVGLVALVVVLTVVLNWYEWRWRKADTVAQASDDKQKGDDHDA